MKSIYIVLFSFLSFVANGQGDFINPTNTSCQASERLCSDSKSPITFSRAFNFTSSPSCINGKVKLYYSFKAGFTTSTNPLFSYTSGTLTTTYKIFGPFNSTANACEQIQNLTANLLATNTALTTSKTVTAPVQANQFYVVEIVANACSGTLNFTIPLRTLSCSTEIACEDCVGTFQPKDGDFILSAWVKKEVDNDVAVTTYSNVAIEINAGSSVQSFTPSGQIIDGWQRIEGVFTAGSIGQIEVKLVSNSGDAYFDDIRIFPFNGSMMSYVYDPITLRLLAELDERNYAKLYEYDEEGKLVRVKKETEKGIMTIQENRDNNSKE